MVLLLNVALALGLLAAAWSAGFFWTWSFTVMPGLGVAAPEAMGAVNANARSAGFAFVFFGPPLFAALAGGLALVVQARPAALAVFAAVVMYAAGVLAVTFAVHLPLNEWLAAAPGAAGEVWRDDAAPWTAWNHLRTAGATTAFLLLVVAAVAVRR